MEPPRDVNVNTVMPIVAEHDAWIAHEKARRHAAAARRAKIVTAIVASVSGTLALAAIGWLIQHIAIH